MLRWLSDVRIFWRLWQHRHETAAALDASWREMEDLYSEIWPVPTLPTAEMLPVIQRGDKAVRDFRELLDNGRAE